MSDEVGVVIVEWRESMLGTTQLRVRTSENGPDRWADVPVTSEIRMALDDLREAIRNAKLRS